MSIYLIAGGAGFLGAAIAERLARSGHEVRVLDNCSGPDSLLRFEDLHRQRNVTAVHGDIRDAALCRSICEGADILLHFAAPRDVDGDSACMDVIVNGTFHLLDILRCSPTAKRLIVASTGAVYGDGPALSRHEAALPEPSLPRACAALSAEHFCRAAYRRYGTQAVCLRYFDVYGPGMDLAAGSGAPLAALLEAAAFGGTANVAGDSDAGRDYLFVADAVDAALLAAGALRGVSGKVFNIGSGRRITVQHTRELLEQGTGHPITIERSTPKPGEIWQGRADIAAAAGLLQFTAQVSFADGLARTLQWARDLSAHQQEICIA